jgi:hypothetical protein
MRAQTMRIVAYTLIVQAALLVALFMVVFVVRAACHECLAAPSVAVCEHSYRGRAVDLQIESNRVGGYIKERQFAGCYFYWHESNRGGN